jgi:hypothetical protein
MKKTSIFTLSLVAAQLFFSGHMPPAWAMESLLLPEQDARVQGAPTANPTEQKGLSPEQRREIQIPQDVCPGLVRLLESVALGDAMLLSGDLPKMLAASDLVGIRLEADYILSCQFWEPGNPAHGAINNVHGDPT